MYSRLSYSDVEARLSRERARLLSRLRLGDKDLVVSDFDELFALKRELLVREGLDPSGVYEWFVSEFQFQ